MTACHPSDPEVSVQETVDVRVVSPELRSIPRRVSLPGTVQSADRAAIAAKVAGMVKAVPVAIGQSVEQGDLLVSLDAAEYSARREQVAAALAEIQRNLEREQRLLERNASTAETVRALQDRLRQTKAQLQEADIMLGYTEIRAPFSGVITAKPIEPGDFASPGQALLTLENLEQLEVHVQVPDSLSVLDSERPIECVADDSGFSATVSEWSPAADPSSRTRLVKLAVATDASRLRSGQYIEVLWPAESTPSLWVPVAAVRRTGQLERVFAVGPDNQLQLHLVRTGQEQGDDVQIISGLPMDLPVVIHADSQLSDGHPAHVIP